MIMEEKIPEAVLMDTAVVWVATAVTRAIAAEAIMEGKITVTNNQVVTMATQVKADTLAVKVDITTREVVVIAGAIQATPVPVIMAAMVAVLIAAVWMMIGAAGAHMGVVEI